ncbi:MAG TPA: molybdopterin-guanine dinucleotide biosynthesis protein B [Steroidobacteraceae bacterium]|jgi:molybdopterin-guanine dinucleotide biosynthesis protein B|nr:molybdopterin-guanine dinucleotide biosynthesis protein B [Steroidobacteraceae bacterium]
MTRVLGIAGWSGSGKTTLLTRLIPLLRSRGLNVATLKHAHHSFDVDQPGKDSYVHRQAGAGEVIVSSARRWVQMHEIGDGREATLPELLARLSPCDLVLIEGFKRERYPKLEVFRAALGKAPLYPQDELILAIASDPVLTSTGLPCADLNDVPAIADLVVSLAQPIDAVVETLVASAS